MRIVILDSKTLDPGDISWDRMKELGTLERYDRTPVDLVTSRIGDAEIVFTNKTVIDEEVLNACPNIKWIGVFGTGYNVVDADACKKRGILLANVPDYSTKAVAQHTFALLLEIACRVGEHSDAVAKGEWITSADFCFTNNRLIELYEKTFGVIGFGNTGKAVAQIAQAMGMNVLVYTRHPNLSYESETLKFVSREDLFGKCDIISLHCPLTEETRGMINKECINKMKDGVILINTARGPILNEQDVKDALECGKIYALGADVVSVEPMRDDNPLLTAKNAIITPHIAWAPKETRERLMRVCVENLKSFLDGNPQNIVNL